MKNKQALSLIVLANSISGMATGISMIAVPWYFSAMIGKPHLFGLFYLAATALSLIWVMFSGVLIDRYDRKHIYMAVSGVGSAVALGVAGYGYMNGAVPEILAGLVFSSTFLIYSIHYPNLYAFAQEITDPKHYGRITSILEIQGQFSNAVAGGIAAILLTGTQGGMMPVFGREIPIGLDITAWELHDVFLLDGVTYLLAVILVAFIRYKSIAERKQESGSNFDRLKEGVSFLKKNPLIFLFGNASYSIFVTILVTHFFLLPNYVDQHLGGLSSDYASAEMFFATGALLAGIGIRYFFRKMTTVSAVILLHVLVFIGYLYSSFDIPIIWFFPAYFLLGFCNAGTRIMRITYIFKLVPNQVIGRTNSVFQLINILIRMFFIGIFSLAWFTSDGNVVYAFLMQGGFVLLSAIVLLLNYKPLVALTQQKVHPDTTGE